MSLSTGILIGWRETKETGQSMSLHQGGGFQRWPACQTTTEEEDILLPWQGVWWHHPRAREHSWSISRRKWRLLALAHHLRLLPDPCEINNSAPLCSLVLAHQSPTEEPAGDRTSEAMHQIKLSSLNCFPWESCRGDAKRSNEKEEPSASLAGCDGQLRNSHLTCYTHDDIKITREWGTATVEGDLSRLVSAFLGWGQNFKFVK